MMTHLSLMPRRSGSPAVLSVVLALLSPWLPAAVFEDDFEGDAAGSTAAWDVGDGAPVVDDATFALFGSPNHCLDLSDPARKLLTGIAGFAAGTVTTFSCDFAELSGGAQTSGLQVGYSQDPEINTAGAAARVQLLAGTVHHVNLGGLSSLTQTGDLGYAENQPHRIYLVVNDREDPLIDYAGDEDLAAHSFEVWLRSGPTLQHVLEATIGRELKYAGLRTWSGFDSAFFVDRVRIDLGVNLTPGDQGCRLEVSHPGVAAGGTCTLAWTATALPAGTTYEITSDREVTFSPGAAGGDASAGSGLVDATLLAAGAGELAFTIVFRDPAGAVVCSSRRAVEVVDFSAPSELPHPGVTGSAGQLAFMKEQVLNHPGSLARAGWDAMLASRYADLGYVHAPQQTVSVVPSGSNASEAAFRNDSQAARCHALQWVVTGDPAHRDKALQIVNDWGRTYRGMVSTGSAAQTQLESAWALPVWLGAADILRYHDAGSAGWDATGMASFQIFMRDLCDRARQALARPNNWGVSASLAVMAYGAWSDDPAIFETGLANQMGLLDSISGTNGEIAETCRDTWHPQYSVVSWVDSAELARNLGRPDLYEAVFDGQGTPRLAIILEYFANLMLGNTSHPCGAGWGFDYPGEFNRFDNYEVAYNHYINRVHANYLPVFAEMVEDFWRHDVGADAHFLLWSRLTHGDNAHAPLPPPDYYGQWVAQHFTAHGITDPAVTARGADYNGDGITNALHYWTRTDPRAAAGEPVLSAVEAEVPGGFRVRFVERPEAGAYGREFRFSSDLADNPATWPVVEPVSNTIVEDRGDQVVREAVFPADGPQGFIVISYPAMAE